MEENIQQTTIPGVSPRILRLLLQDKATGKNIVWATDNYIQRGEEYAASCEILLELITGPNTRIIQPRVHKSREDQSDRTRKRGEVYTPFFICKKMCDHAHKVLCGEGDWKHYVDARVLELTCGEAPFLVSPYDAATGEAIPLEQRAGLLDRKLRKVNDNAQTEEEWLTWAFRAVQSTYGYEYQGDSLLLARLNILHTFRDYLAARWEREPALNELLKVANIISWNLWQMDGLKNTTPIGSLESKNYIQLTLFGDEDPDPGGPVASQCKTFDWRAKEARYLSKDFSEGVRTMKFDFVIGNPPYNEEAPGGSTSDKPIYHLFMSESYKVADKVLLVTPSRFLFNAGGTPKSWNNEMLQSRHFKVCAYEPVASKWFGKVTFTGGVTITYHDKQQNFEPIKMFIPYSELNSIRNRVVSHKDFKPFSSIVSGRTPYLFTETMHRENPMTHDKLSRGHDMDISSNAFEALPEIFFETETNIQQTYRVLGRIDYKRAYRLILRKYARGRDDSSIDKWKVFLPKANGASGMLGEEAARLISSPEIGKPMDICTDTFIVVGPFDTDYIAIAAHKYILTKFARALLGTLKVTQINSKETWQNVPLQDFTSASDIDWTKSIPEIDQQLYAKYSLSQEEIDFIESHVKEME